MAVTIAAVTAAVALYGPLAQKILALGITMGKKMAEGKDEMDDAEWNLHVAEGDQIGLDFRKLVDRPAP